MQNFSVLSENINAIHHALTPYVCVGLKKRIGAFNDGGYVVVEEALAASEKNLCFGAGGNIDVERQLARAGKPTICFDGEPDFNLLPELSGMNIGDVRILEPNLEYHRSHVTKANLRKIIPTVPFFLKMDIEGGEWEVMRSLTDVDKSLMTMLVVEYHLNNEYYVSRNLMSVFDVLISLKDTHHLVHIHGNNYDIPAYGGTRVPAVVECCYINKSLSLSTDTVDMSSYPTNLDRPCNSARSDIPLNWWKS
jgi:hypothetical protein